MPERQIAKNLQLDENAGRSSAHMELQETGNPVDPRWQLRNDGVVNDWQPVEYARPTQSEPSWVLPSLVGIVLIGVIGYMIYISLNRLSNFDVASVPAENAPLAENSDSTASEPAAPAAAVVQQDATSTPLPTEEPTATAVPTEEPTAEPTVALVEQQIATITSQFGVNARLEPSTTGEVLRILEEGETVVVLDQQASDEISGDWLQVQTSEDAVVWISSEFAEIETQVVPGENGSTATAALPELDVRVTISSPAGLNARAEPDAASEIVALLPDDTSYQAVSQSADGQWIEVALEDGSSAWIFLQLVIPDTDLATLPIFQAEAEAEDDTVASADDTEAAEDDVTDDSASDDAQTGESSADDESTAEAPAAESGTEETATDDTATGETGEAAAEETASDETDADENTGTDAAADAELEDPATEGDVADAVSPPELDSSAIVSITNQFGVNARSTTSTEGEILVVLEPGSSPPLRGRNEDGSWLQVVLDDGTLAWVFTQAVEAPDNLEELPVYEPPAVGVPAETLDAASDAAGDAEEADATAEESADENTGEGAEEEPAAEENTDDAATPEEEAGDDTPADTGITATVSTFLGAKARPAPTTEQEEIETVPFDQELTVLGRSEDTDWIQVELFEGESAWILSSKVDLSVPVEEVPVSE